MILGGDVFRMGEWLRGRRKWLRGRRRGMPALSRMCLWKNTRSPWQTASRTAAAEGPKAVF